MTGFILSGFINHPEGGLLTVTIPIGSRILYDRIPTGFMLVMVIASTDYQGTLTPDNEMFALKVVVQQVLINIAM